MTKEAEAHAEEDKKKKESIDAKNTADALIFTAEKALKDGGDKIPADIKKSVEDKIAALKETLKGEDKEKIEIETRVLAEELQKIGQQMYGSTGSPQGQQQGEKPEEKTEDKKAPEEPVEGEVVK